MGEKAMSIIGAISGQTLLGMTLLLASVLLLGCTQSELVTDDVAEVSAVTDQAPATEVEPSQGRPSREDWERRRQEVFDQLNLTDEQREQLEELDRQYPRGSRENREARHEAMSEILTEEQMTQMRELFRRGRPRD
jgi:Spy/CpxP family protein refolding chaperone